MNLSRRVITLIMLVVAFATGCGTSSNVSRITDVQAENLVDTTNQSIVALHNAGYIALTKRSGDKPMVRFRKCKENSTIENCKDDQEPSVTTPDVYLAVEDADATDLTPTGKYDLLFAASANSNSANGLHCRSVPKSVLTQDSIAAFATVGTQFHDLDYKDLGTASQTKTIDGMKWRCGATFGLYL